MCQQIIPLPPLREQPSNLKGQFVPVDGAALREADLIILDKNPLENIKHSNTIKYVMKNGRLYNGDNGDEIAPAQKKLNKSEWESVAPKRTTTVKE